MQGKPYKEIFYEIDDEEYCVEDDALAILLLGNDLFVLSASDDNDIASIYVNCNDVFWWASADLEPLPIGEVGKLYKYCFDENGERKRWGSMIWACLKRGMRPQHPIEKDMKKEGLWPDELEVLPIREKTG